MWLSVFFKSWEFGGLCQIWKGCATHCCSKGQRALSPTVVWCFFKEFDVWAAKSLSSSCFPGLVSQKKKWQDRLGLSLANFSARCERLRKSRTHTVPKPSGKPPPHLHFELSPGGKDKPWWGAVPSFYFLILLPVTINVDGLWVSASTYTKHGLDCIRAEIAF